jgi:hypothetical protein
VVAEAVVEVAAVAVASAVRVDLLTSDIRVMI